MLKKGFTLVELLAVLVILAIILAIAVPGIFGIVRSSTKGAFANDAKMVIKGIQYRQLENDDFSPLEVTKENMMETIGLSSDNYEQVNISQVGDKIEIILVGDKVWKGFTAYGSINNIKVVDTEDYDVIPPSITIIGDNPIDINKGSVYVDPGATAHDQKDGDIIITSTVIRNASNQVVDIVDTSIFTMYTITYTAVDSQGNTTSSIRRVNVVDRMAPIITLLGENPITVNVGATYSDEGATAIDETDGDITSNIIVTGIVNPNIVGTYTITYDVEDSSSNAAVTVIRTINVVDISAPVITVLGSNPITIDVGSSYSDAGATAIDDVDGDITTEIVTTGTVNPSIVGTYTITYTVSDNSNNIGVASRTVNVVDPILPTVAFGMNGNSTYAKTRSTTVTVSDNLGVNPSSLKYQWTTSINTPLEASFGMTFTNGSTLSTPANGTGSYYLWILAKDVSGNTLIASSNVFNIDNTVPIITISGSNPAAVVIGSQYNDEGATAMDNVNGDITANIQIVSNVNVNALGTYNVTYNVSDSSGNVASSVTRSVVVMNQTSNFNYTSGSQSFVVPVSGTYIITAIGAGGGSDGYNTPGKGALIEGTFALTQGQVINIVVGAAGGSVSVYSGAAGGGGGGGTFVVDTTNGKLLLVAGGGGGSSTSTSGGNAIVGTPGSGNGGTAQTTTGSMGGTGGGAGGGYLTSGSNALSGGYGGSGYNQGSAGGAPGTDGGAGGYGGGGGGGSWNGWSSNYGGGGGGGGYTGGNGGTCTNGGSGGTSYIDASATEVSTVAASNAGNGSVAITYTGSLSRSFVYRGIPQNFTVPATGIYTISVDGAGGGSDGYNTPGKGSHIQGEFTLIKDQVIRLIVAGSGGSVSAYHGAGGGGGGGASYVFNNSTGELLIVAGGGGGSSTSTSGGNSIIGSPGTGNGGTAQTTTGSMGGSGGGGGGGYLTSGANALSGGYGGGGYNQGSSGGTPGSSGGAGGYGGGGGGGAWNDWSSNYGGGGGGGGYTGGNGGTCTNGGSGGTSYISSSATNVSNTAGVITGNGYITISFTR